MKSIPSFSRKKSTTRATDCSNKSKVQSPRSKVQGPRSKVVAFLLYAVLIAGCARQMAPLPEYPEFVSLRQKTLPTGVIEIYGRLSATVSGKTAHSKLNILLDPGKMVYLEITGPDGHLINSVSLNPAEFSILWTDDKNYIKEPSTPENLNAVTGLAILPDDLLFLLAGLGLNFPKWKLDGTARNVWVLSRSGFEADLTMQEQISLISLAPAESRPVQVRYDRYRTMDNRSLPARIRFEVSASHIKLEMQIDKWIPRDEPATADMFDLKLPADAHRLSLRDMYHGKPLLLQ